MFDKIILRSDHEGVKFGKYHRVHDVPAHHAAPLCRGRRPGAKTRSRPVIRADRPAQTGILPIAPRLVEQPTWTFADVWETVADAKPDAIAQVHGTLRTTWRDFDRRADGIAAALLKAGVRQQDKVALYLHNAPEYLEAAFAALKAALVPVNTNYRYLSDELLYLWTNADADAVVFHGSFTERVAELRQR